MFQLSRWCLVMTPKAALHILGIIPSSSTTFASSSFPLSSCSGEEKGEDLKVFSSVFPSTQNVHQSCASSTYIASHLLEKLTPAKIKKAYISRTLLCHPDLYPDDPRANEKFQHLGEALRVALHVLQTHRQRGGGGGRRPHGAGDDDDTTLASSSSRSDPWETIQDAMATFRRCMVAFHHHEKREKRRKNHLIHAVEKKKENANEEGISSPHRPSVSPPSHSRKNTAGATMAEKNNTDDDDDGNDPFFVHSFLEVPSLEHIRDVCQREHTAFLQTQELCATLPPLLSGEGTALFDSTAFFFSRYVSLTLSCVSRFIRHLPIIVRRVVLQRQRRFRSTLMRGRHSLPHSSGVSRGPTVPPTHTEPTWPASSSSTVEAGGRKGRHRVISGLGTGNRPQRQQKIEDMAMKPLVLMGVLLFDTVSVSPATDQKHMGKPQAEETAFDQAQEARSTSSSTTPRKKVVPHRSGSLEGMGKEKHAREDDKTERPEQQQPPQREEEPPIDTAEEMQQSSTCPGVHHPSDIHVCQALQCRIHPTDTMESIVDKLADWEQRSFERLQVELAMADVTALMSDMVMPASRSTSPSRKTSPSVMVVRPHLEASLEEAMGVLEMVQMLATEMCAYQEDRLDSIYSDEVVREEIWRERGRKDCEKEPQKDAANAEERDGTLSSSPPSSTSSASSSSTTTEHESPILGKGSSAEREACVRDAEESWWWKHAVACQKVSPLSLRPSSSGTTRTMEETHRPHDPLQKKEHSSFSSFSQSHSTPTPSIDTRPLLPFLLALCRTLSRLAGESIRGNITLTWPPPHHPRCHRASPNSMPDASNASEWKDSRSDGKPPRHGGRSHEKTQNEKEQPERNEKKEEEEKEEEDTKRHSSTPEAHPNSSTTASSSSSWRVSRHPTACVGEDISFTVHVELIPDILVFLSRWAAAMTKVLALTERSHAALPALRTLRDQMVKEEFIPRKNPQRERSEEEEEKINKTTDERDLHVRRNGTSSAATTTTLASTAVDTIHNDVGCNSEKSVGKEATNTEDNDKEKKEEEEVVMGNDTEKEKEDESTEYDYRAPLLMFPRLFNMHTWQEKLFWDRVKEHRVYLGHFTLMISPFQVFLDCLPYDPSTAHPILEENPSSVSPGALSEEDKEGGYASGASHIPPGWVGHLESDGSDQVIITSSLLSSPGDFRAWLEDVVEQSSLQKEVERILREENIFYVQRDPSLPLTHFLSFLHVFRKAGAVRSVLEAHSSDHGIGWIIVVGTKCDIREGKLCISWYMDPSALIRLLQGNNGGTSIMEIHTDTDDTKNSILFLAEV